MLIVSASEKTWHFSQIFFFLLRILNVWSNSCPVNWACKGSKCPFLSIPLRIFFPFPRGPPLRSVWHVLGTKKCNQCAGAVLLWKNAMETLKGAIVKDCMCVFLCVRVWASVLKTGWGWKTSLTDYSFQRWLWGHLSEAFSKCFQTWTPSDSSRCFCYSNTNLSSLSVPFNPKHSSGLAPKLTEDLSAYQLRQKVE